MQNHTFAPIVLFVYNRPEHTRKTVEALLRNCGAEQTEIYIYSVMQQRMIMQEKRLMQSEIM